MKFSTLEDIEAPIDQVWAAVTDARSFERKAMRKGVEVQRLSEEEMDLGSGWTARFEYRGMSREMETVVTEFEAPRLLEMDSSVGGIEGFLTVELSALSAGLTRMTLQFEVKPNTISAKMVVQTMKLVKAQLDRRFRRLVQTFAKSVGGAN